MLTFENYVAQDQGNMHLLDLPVVMIEHIFSFLTYDEIAKNRIICKDFDSICQRMLNRGFLLIERRHALSLKAIKAQLPRRESERRFHAFAKHNDILTSIETRLSMLSMTYAKFIDQNVCCFIPGKVIDEIDGLLGIVEHSPVLPRAHEVLQELRDISSMAIEHFDDKISPELRQRMLGGKPFNAPQPVPNAAANSGGDPNQSCSAETGNEIACIRNRCLKNHRSILQMSKKYSKVWKRMKMYKRQLTNQNRHIKELSRRQADQDGNMAELKKRIEECDVKYQELTHSQVSGGKGIKDIAVSPALNCVSGTSSQSTSATLKNFSSQIKLDPSHLHMGPTRGSPNIRPRKASVDQPPNREHASTNQTPLAKVRGHHSQGRGQPLSSRFTQIRPLAKGTRQKTSSEAVQTKLSPSKNAHQRGLKRGNFSECIIDNTLTKSVVDLMNESDLICHNKNSVSSFVGCNIAKSNSRIGTPNTSCEDATAGPSSASQNQSSNSYVGQMKRRKSFESLYKAFAIIDEPSEAEKSGIDAKRNNNPNKITRDQVLNFIARVQNVNRRNTRENPFPLDCNVRNEVTNRVDDAGKDAICDEFVAVGDKLVSVSQLAAEQPLAEPIAEPHNIDTFLKRKRVYSEGCIGCLNIDKIPLIRQCKMCEKSNAEEPAVDTKRHKL